MGFFRQEYWSGLPLPSPRDPPDPQIEPAFPSLGGRSSPLSLLLSPTQKCYRGFIFSNLVIPFLRLYPKKTFHIKIKRFGKHAHNNAIWCCSVAKLCLTLFDPKNYSMPGFSVLHHLPEFAQIHVHWVGDATQPSHPLLPPSLPATIFPSIRVLFTL